jgi:two-component system response regulator HydG
MRDIPTDTDLKSELPAAALDNGLPKVREFRLGQLAVETLRGVWPLPNDDPPRDRLLQHDAVSLKQARDIIERIAVSDANVLISGESGTGKESVAEFIHDASRFAAAPLPRIDCAGIPPSRIYDALFGSPRESAEPLISLCAEGNVFWDEIFALPENAQDRLLRALQSRTFKAPGHPERIVLSARLLSSTNRNIPIELQTGHFRTDLCNCLATIRIHLTSLHEQSAEILPLADYFLERATAEKAKPKKLHQKVQDLFQKYSWPGNLRQLRLTIEQAAQIAKSTVLLQHLPAPMLAWSKRNTPRSKTPPPAPIRAKPIFAYDRGHVEAALKRHFGSVQAAAKELRVTRQGFYKMLKRYSISPEDFRG